MACTLEDTYNIVLWNDMLDTSAFDTFDDYILFILNC